MIDRDYMRSDFGGGGSFQMLMPRLTPVVKWILLANVAGQILVFSWTGTVLHYLSLNTATPWFFPFQVFTYQFLHDPTNLFHLILNMLVLYFFGTTVEGWLGSRRFLRLYLASGVAGGVFYLLFSLLRGGGGICIGASGAVSGVVLYFCLVQPMAEILVLFIPVRAWIFGAFWVLYSLYNMLVDLRFGAGGHVADAAHLGGALMGIAFWRYEGLARRWMESLARKRRLEQARKLARDRERMDELLDKVKREGLHSLSEKERRFLQEMSGRLKGGS